MINEKTDATGVTVDGVLCKDGVIPNAVYPNALLLDGSRAMTGGIKWVNCQLTEGGAGDIITVRNIDNTDYRALKGVLMPVGNMYMQNQGRLATDWSTASYFLSQYIGGGVFTDIAEVHNEMIDISRAGNITFLDDKFLKIGKDSDGTLPTPDASYRGKMIRVEGGAGVADKLYMCMKSAADTYSWVQIATG